MLTRREQRNKQKRNRVIVLVLLALTSLYTISHIAYTISGILEERHYCNSDLTSQNLGGECKLEADNIFEWHYYYYDQTSIDMLQEENK